uniref:Uncharacterized protein n=1 Tax=Arundo donax TaxID=35708 RepID=A0A0A8ZXA9_ARUDO
MESVSSKLIEKIISDVSHGFQIFSLAALVSCFTMSRL